MGLSGALQVGRSGLLANQVALQTTGNNLANIATEGYHRQRITLSPLRNQEIQNGVFVGTGVGIQSITRIVDEALESRLRGSITDQSGSLISQDLLRQIESIENEFSEIDLSTRLSKFFNAWSELANNPQDLSLRTLVLQEGKTIADFVSNLRGEFTALRSQVDNAADTGAERVDGLLTQIAELNRRISVQEHGTGGAAGLRDQRDSLLQELAKHIDISTVEQTNGSVDVFIGSLPIILNGQSRGVELKTEKVDGERQISLVVSSDQSPLDISNGELGAIVAFRKQDLQEAIDTLDTFAAQLIFQTNRVHSQGQGTVGYDDLTNVYQVLDTAAALNDSDATGLDFTPAHGSFLIHVTQKSTGQRVSTRVDIDLDGVNSGADTTLTSLAADLDAADDISAAIGTDGRITITADSGGFEFTFSDDTSGILTALGFNTFFTGGDAADIAVNAYLIATPALLAAGQNHILGDNRNALALVGLRDTGVSELDGFSLTEYWNRHVEDFAIRLGTAQEAVAADTVIRENLQAQQQSISGVNADEEVINLIQSQRAFQASARFISVVDELMDTLLGLV